MTLRRMSQIAAWCVLWLMATPARAQVGAGNLVGTVTDQNGAVVAGAVVTVTSMATEFARSAVTGDDGGFAVPSLILVPMGYPSKGTGFAP